jgi:hypothetical protein
MNAIAITAITLGVAALLGGFAAFKQARELEQLRSATAQLRQSQARLASAPVPSPAPATPTPALSEAQKLELLKLRGEVTRLRERQRELAGAAAENSRLKAKSGGVGALPPGYVKRADAKYAGMATPEAAFQSFLWAIEHEDTNVLLQVMTEEGAVGFREALHARGAEEFWKEVKMIPGFRLLGQRQREDGVVMLKFEMLPGDPPHEMKAQLVGGTWKLSP